MNAGAPGPPFRVLVAAADGEVGRVAGEIDRHRAGGVRQVPDRQRPGGVGGGGQLAHPVHPAGPVVDMGQQQHRRPVVEVRRQIGSVDQRQLAPVRSGQRVGDVEVGREVGALRDDPAAAGSVGGNQGDGGAERLVEVDRGGIGDGQLTGAGADQPGNLVADPLRQRDPAGGVPAADEAAAPFLADDRVDPVGGGPRQRAEGIAVEVDEAVGVDVVEREKRPERRQPIGRIQRQAVGARRHQSARSTARTGDASAPTSFSGRAISS